MKWVRTCGTELTVVIRAPQPSIACSLPRRHEGPHQWDGGKDRYAIWTDDGHVVTVQAMYL